jgi:hypothetical protein
MPVEETPGKKETPSACELSPWLNEQMNIHLQF